MTSKPVSTGASPRGVGRWYVSAFVIALLAGWGALLWFDTDLPPDLLLERASRMRSAGKIDQAETLAASVLTQQKESTVAVLLAADCAVDRRDYERAIAYLDQFESSHAHARAQVALRSAELNLDRLYRVSAAERRYRAALDAEPENGEANAGLARLLALCARKPEAIPYALQLVKLGVETDLLVLLSIEDGVVNDQELLRKARQVDPQDPAPLVGLAWHAGQAEHTDEAIALLRDALRLSPGFVPAHAGLGRQLLASERFSELIDWAAQLPSAADESAETWLVRGGLAEHLRDRRGAIRCCWEAARIAPGSKQPNFRLARLLAEEGAEQGSQRFAAHLGRIQALEEIQNRVIFARDHTDANPMLDLAESYEAAGRLWEAYGWCRFAARLDGRNQRYVPILARLERKVRNLPLKLTADSANVALAVDLSSYPLPDFRTSASAPTRAVVEGTSQSTPTFRNDAPAAGLRFRYFNGTEGTPQHRMYEFTGGGIGALDFDLDGYTDLYFTQGRPWPPEGPRSQFTDQLFRNLDGQRFVDVTRTAGIAEDGFGQGVTVGDFDADGFADIFVGNIGGNQLWRNNGDGTFSDATSTAGITGDEWTTSCALADLDGDGLSDIYAVSYLTGDDVYDRVCRHNDGAPKLCMPFDFHGQRDRVWRNEGNGRFHEVTDELLSIAPDGMGLGIAVWDAHGEGRLSVLVANDTTPNFFFVPERTEHGQFKLRESGIASGLALNGEGKATGCMGIALGDVNDDGRLDVHITNFYAESNTLYLSRSGGFFDDQTRAMGLYEPSLNMLGFGTQFLDADLDGRLELFVANGHVDDLSVLGRPYRMPAQMFQLRGQRFAEIPAVQLGDWFQQQWLGRSAIRLDWNRDGLEDVAVGLLDDESALLTNCTAVAGNSVTLKLIGVQSNRDAIGTTVTARIGDRTYVRQLTAGDGYHASNERRLIFGMGSAAEIDELIVRWPSGREQQLSHVAASQELWLREGFVPVALSRTP